MVTWEALTLPLLRYVAACKGSARRENAIEWLAGRFGNPDSSLNSPFGMRVMSAAYSLLAAGLIGPSTFGDWCPTNLGLEVLSSPPDQIDRSFLKGIPQYNDHGKQKKREWRAKAFQDRRFEFYASGRLLYFQHAHTAASILLAYSIESHLKMALCLIEDRWTERDRALVERGHNLKQLYVRGREVGFWEKCAISEDFLDYVHDQFERRYPESEKKALERRGMLRFGGWVIHTYDDCITQLDDSLCDACGDHSLSLGAAACSGYSPRGELARAFYHCNPFALSRKPQYDRTVSTLGKARHFDLPDGDALFYYEHLPPPSIAQPSYMQLLELRLAALFRLPRKGEPDPDPAGILLSRPVQTHSFGSEWVLARLREEFGPFSVSVQKDYSEQVVTAFVFDRTAKKWWRPLVLSRNHATFWFRSPAAEKALGEWIREARKQFKEKRRSKRKLAAEGQTRVE